MENKAMDIDLQKMSDSELDRLWSALFIERMRRLQPEPDETVHADMMQDLDERFEDMLQWSNEVFNERTVKE